MKSNKQFWHLIFAISVVGFVLDAFHGRSTDADLLGMLIAILGVQVSEVTP